MKSTNIDKCKAKCWCHYCNNEIKKDDSLMEIYKKAFKGVARINICAICIKELAKQIKPKEIKEIINKRVIEEL